MTKYLTLMDGTVFSGTAFGLDDTVFGAILIDNSMIGYVERLTESQSSGKIVVFTFPEIGNYGVPSEFFDKKITAKAVVINNLCRTPSNFDSVSDFNTWLERNGVVGIYGIDTRLLAVHIRERGEQEAMLTNDPIKVDLRGLIRGEI